MNPRHLECPRYNSGTRTLFLADFRVINEAIKWASNVNQTWQTAKMPQNWKLNNLDELLNLAHFWRLVLLCKTLRFALLMDCTFLYLSTLVVLHKYLCCNYLWNHKTIPHGFFTYLYCKLYMQVKLYLQPSESFVSPIWYSCFSKMKFFYI